MDEAIEWSDFWLPRLVTNIFAYSTVIIPSALLIGYLKSRPDTGHSARHWFWRLFVFGNEVDPADTLEGGASDTPATVPTATSSPSARQEVRSTLKLALKALCYFCGLQMTYLTWGVLQERIMTRDFVGANGAERFKNSQFLVFMNRILALVLSLLWLVATTQARHKPPLYRYSYCSFSNILSSWCQYEALKYVTFPTQVLAKASKVIPTMFMGKLVSKKTYQWYEYFTAVLISVGMSIFLLSSSFAQKRNLATQTTFSGFILLIGYLFFDSFTSNWQDALFKQYDVTAMQMMAGVNFFSVIFTGISLVEQGGFVYSLTFMASHVDFAFEVVLLSACSALGQLFIFYTIRDFGAVAFAIMMTVRQIISIVLSCIIYEHYLPPVAISGIVVVFCAVFMRQYCGYRKRRLDAIARSQNGATKS